MGGLKNIASKVLEVAKPFVSAVNPMLGAAMGFASNLLQGKNPLQALLGAATDLIPGGMGGVMGNVLGKFGGSALMEGMGGNSLLNGALNWASNKGGVTDVIGNVLKNSQKKEEMTEQSLKNTTELSALRMAQMLIA